MDRSGTDWQQAMLPCHTAIMQGPDWDDLRYLLALARRGSFAGAARDLRLDATTVSRRLRALEHALSVRLFIRGADGALAPTAAGTLAIRRAEAIEAEIGGLRAAVEGVDTPVQGSVRVTTVPILANRILIPALPDLIGKYPTLRIEIAADFRDYNLVRREADIAVRFARPDARLGSRILARRIAVLDYSPYCAAEMRGQGTAIPWLGYDDNFKDLPQAEWLRHAKGRKSALCLNDAESFIHAAVTGLGRILLPRRIGDAEPRLKRLRADELPPLPTREVWLLTHRDLRPLPRIRAVVDWLGAIFR
ncbi:LysR family transcriptional regulator [Dongia sp.]|uniref:LysR family transcriptional regulator n=1 Tax=Dongia sp. TaxID=1977262 RepID=UPI0035AF9586